MRSSLAAAVTLLAIISFSTAQAVVDSSIDRDERLRLRDRAAKMWYHGYDAYMWNAFPKDELLPLSCTGTNNFGGCGGKPCTDGMALTLIDALDTLVILGNCSEFEKRVKWVVENVSFDQDKTVSLFETTIRVLGGLLSAHELAADPSVPCFATPGDYDGGLLRMAHDLGQRFLPAFETPTGVPFGSVNLRHGVAADESNVTASATAGTLALEFWTLSRLTGDPRFEAAAMKALRGLWKLRSSINLVGAHLNIKSGAWEQKDAGIGGLIDSFYEYLVKANVLTGSAEFLEIFNPAYSAVMSSLKLGPWYVEVNMDNGGVTWPHFSSLQSFFPGVQATIGDLLIAQETEEAFYRLWRLLGVVPEGFTLFKQRVVNGQAGYPLRPELLESAFYLHRTTLDPAYFELGRQGMASIEMMTKVPCGYAAIVDVTTHDLEDRMDSFILSETIKYLYLLFDTDSFVRNGRYVLNTEGHPLLVPERRATMTDSRKEQWMDAIDAYLPDEEPAVEVGAEEAGQSNCSSTAASAPAFEYRVWGAGNVSALPFVSVRGQCELPPMHVWTIPRGLNRSILTEDDMLEPIREAHQAMQERTTNAMTAMTPAQMQTMFGKAAASGPSDMAGAATRWLMNLFQQDGKDGKTVQKIELNADSLKTLLEKMGQNTPTKPSKTVGGVATTCASFAGWHDRDGDECSAYSQSVCGEQAEVFAPQGGQFAAVSANVACCICGGGKKKLSLPPPQQPKQNVAEPVALSAERPCVKHMQDGWWTVELCGKTLRQFHLEGDVRDPSHLLGTLDASANIAEVADEKSFRFSDGDSCGEPRQPSQPRSAMVTHSCHSELGSANFQLVATSEPKPCSYEVQVHDPQLCRSESQ